VRGVIEFVDGENAGAEHEMQFSRTCAGFCFAIPSSESAVVSAVQAVRKGMELIALDEDWIFRVELSLQEALLNGHFHGNRSNSAREIRVACILSLKKVEVHVEDDGVGYDLKQDFFVIDHPKPGGRGLYLIRQLMDSVTISDSGSQISMALAKE
jgi:anti-sigma regulatory factor (Ser/Thr protein kinase)